MLDRMDYRHPERAFVQKSLTFGLGQTNWAENFGDIWGTVVVILVGINAFLALF